MIAGVIAYKCRELIKRRLYKVPLSDYTLIQKLGDIIHEQNLFLREDEKIESSVRFEFYREDNYLVIKAWPGGSGLVDKVRNLDLELENKLSKELRHKENELDVAVYYFLNHKEKAYEFPYDIPESEEKIIPVTSTVAWQIDKDPHALIAGGTGGGKTYFLFYLLYQFFLKNYQVYLCDPKRSDLYMSREILSEYACAIEYSPGGIAKNIRLVKEEMQRRYQILDKNSYYIGRSYSDENFSPVFLIIDEFGSFMAGCEGKLKTEVLNNLRQIIFQGRQAGVFVILATQKSDADTIPTEIRDQLGFKAVLGNLSKDGYRMVFGSHDGMNYKTCAPGSGYLFSDSMKSDIPVRFKAPIIENLNDVIKEIRRIKYSQEEDIRAQS